MNNTNTILNNNTNFEDFNERLSLKTLVNIYTLLNIIIAMIISLFIIIYIIRIYISKKHSKKSFHVSLILTCNTCLAIIGSSLTLCLITLSSISGDQNINYLKKIIYWGCHTRGYLLIVFITSIYLSYVLQAGYRLFRIVYHRYKSLRTISTFSYYIFAQWFLSFILILPMLFADKNNSSFIIYLSKEYNCLVSFTNIRGIIFLMPTMCLFPLCCLCLIYSCIIIHIRRRRRQQPTSTLKLRRQNKRDTIIIKRICIVMILLFTLGIPLIIFFIIFIITGHLHWIAYRIFWMTMSISFVFISLSSLYVTPQIYKKIRSIFGHSKTHKEHYRISYSININIEREKKIESLLLENTTFTDSNIMIQLK